MPTLLPHLVQNHIAAETERRRGSLKQLMQIRHVRGDKSTTRPRMLTAFFQQLVDEFFKTFRRQTHVR